MKIATIDREIFHIFWTTWNILMKFSGKMWLMIRGGQIDPPPPAVLGLKFKIFMTSS